MKKRSLVTRACALGMSLAMLMATTAMAAPLIGDSAGSGDLDVDNTVKNPKYSFVVPTVTTFAVDPFAQMDGTNQIFSGDFTFWNKSNVGIKVVVKPKLTINGASNITLVTPGAIDALLPTDTDKKAYVSMAVATSIVETDFTTPATATVGAIDYAGAPELKLTATEGQLTFALGAATYNTDGTIKALAPNTAVAATRLKGKVNSNATWAANEITLNFAYTVSGLSKETETKLRTDATAGTKVGKNLVGGAEATLPNYTQSKANLKDISYPIISPANLSSKHSKVECFFPNNTLKNVVGPAYTLLSSGKLTLPAVAPFWSSLTNETYTYKITFNNGATESFTVTVTN